MFTNNNVLTFTSIEEYNNHHWDVEFWQPYVDEILHHHGLTDAGQESTAGVSGTYPTFICDKYVVKLFGYVQGWEKSYASESAALDLLSCDKEIVAPNLLAKGCLYDNIDAPWPYLVTRRMTGLNFWDAQLSVGQRFAVAADLGRQMKRVHALNPTDITTDDDWSSLDVVSAARRSFLPTHLIEQIDDYLKRFPFERFDRVFVHSDVTGLHVFTENGRLSGIIDWGDSMVTDRHFDLIQIHRDIFNCDKMLLRAFLNAYDWPMSKDLPQRALVLALYRQAVGCRRWPGINVFWQVAEQLPLEDIETLDELANELFGV